MKRRLIILSILIVAITYANAQMKGNAKLFAFSQAVSSGVSPNEIKEDGTTVTNPPIPRGNFWLYVSYNSSSSSIQPSEIWMNGKRYGVKQENISKSPVVIASYDPTTDKEKNITLVPKTTSKIIKLTLVEAMGKTLLKTSSLAKQNAVVLVYNYNGSTYYTTLKQIKKLEKAYMQ